MKRLIIILIPFLIFSFSCNEKKEKKIVEKKIIKKKIYTQNHLMAATLWQQSSAESKALNYQNYKLATMLLNKSLTKTKTKKPMALITDLDETVIDNSAYNARMIINNMPYSSESWNKWVKESRSIAGCIRVF